MLRCSGFLMKFILLVFLVASSGCLDEAKELNAIDAGDRDTTTLAPDSTDSVNRCDTAGCQEGVCDVESGACVECKNSSDCPDSKYCAEMTCVQCTNENHCSTPQASKCEANSCVQCSEGADCAHLNGNLRGCAEGVCVGCATDADCQNSFVCDLRTHTCSTTIKFNSQDGCKPCVSLSSCKRDFACVPLEFKQQPQGYYCMPVATSDNCSSPYGYGSDERLDISDTSVVVCVPDEKLTTCDAIFQYKKVCTLSGNECDAPGSSCEQFGQGNFACTYPCLNDKYCRSSVTCPMTLDAFCGLD